jgi:hypothetical protein
MAIATTRASTTTKTSRTQSVAVPSRGDVLVHREREQRAPYRNQGHKGAGTPQEQPVEIHIGDGEDVAEQEAHEVGLAPARE